MTVGSVVSLAVVLLIAPALPGIATRTRSLLTGRRGAPVLQLYADLGKLWRKHAVYSDTTTTVFRLGPVVLAATTFAAACLVPLDGRTSIFGFTGDLVAFAGLLALGRFALVLAALDTGSSFEGMGASREVTVAAFAEPALFLSFTVLAVASRELDLGGMLGASLREAWTATAPSVLLTAGSLFVLLLAETARVPVDDPATHLELTMIHEVMVLDHSGPDLALIHYAGALKMAIFASIIGNLIVPRAGLSPIPGLIVLVALLAVLAVSVGVVESVMARLRLNRVPQLLVAAAALAGLGMILLLR